MRETRLRPLPSLVSMVALFLLILAGSPALAQSVSPPIRLQTAPAAPSAPEAPARIVRYVDRSATGFNDGTSWANAYTDLQTALANSVSGTDLWVAEGRYTPHATDRAVSFVLKNGVSIFGGFPAGGGDGTIAARFPAGHPTILTGNINNTLLASDNSYHVVTAQNVSSEVVLDGVTIADGRADQGSNIVAGGLLLRNSVVVLRNCVIRNNYGLAGTPALRADSGGSLTLEDCRVTDNQTDGQGSAIILAETQTTIVRTFFTANSAASIIGPIWAQNSAVTVYNSVLANNSNGANGFGAIVVAGGSVVLHHVTITGHTEKAVAGSNSAHIGINNSILWGNGAPEITNPDGASTSVGSSIVQGGYAFGTNVLTTDPLFLSSTDFRLGELSPAKDSANPSTCQAQDILGYPRPNGNGCDMGAYEMFNSWTFCSNPNRTIPDNTAAGLPDSLTVTTTGTIVDVDFYLNVTHPFVGDLSASLTHLGNGQTQTVLTQPQKADGGPCTGDNVDAWMDDASATPVDDTCNISPPAIGGRVAPSNPLALFNNTVLTRPSIWFLNIRDNAAGDVGTLRSWCIQLTMTESRIVTRLDDPTPDGCQPNDCSLREAIITANASPQSESIIFAVDGTFTLSRAGRDENDGLTGDLDITQPLTIIGNGADKTIIDGGAIDRVFDVYDTPVTFSDLTIQNGLANSGSGGGILLYDSNSQAHLLRTVLRNNHAPNGPGGALSNASGRFVLEESAVYGNSASQISALSNQLGDSKIVNSSIFGNTGALGSVSNVSGLGKDATLTIRNSTIVPGDDYPAILNYADSDNDAIVMLQNSIVSALSTHCQSSTNGGAVTFTSLGHNIAGDSTCNLTATGDQPNTDARLAPASDNGGLTPTLALLPGSPALDAGNDATCTVNDQRGLPRLDKDGNGDGGTDRNACDIGAYEAQTQPRAFIYLPLLVR